MSKYIDHRHTCRSANSTTLCDPSLQCSIVRDPPSWCKSSMLWSQTARKFNMLPLSREWEAFCKVIDPELIRNGTGQLLVIECRTSSTECILFVFLFFTVHTYNTIIPIATTLLHSAFSFGSNASRRCSTLISFLSIVRSRVHCSSFGSFREI